MRDRLEIYIGKLPPAHKRIVRQMVADSLRDFLDNRITQVDTLRALAKAKIDDLEGKNEQPIG